MNNTKYINDCVNEGHEFAFIKETAKHYHLDYYKLCDFTFDSYNYWKRQKDNEGHLITDYQARIKALNDTDDYARRC